MQQSPVDERVAADQALRTALVRGQENLYLRDLYVALAGTGGDQFCHVGPTGPRCFGTTGAIARLNLRRGTQEIVVSGLPSLAGAGGGAAGGPHDVCRSRVKAICS